MKKLFGLLISGLMIFSLAACGGGTPSAAGGASAGDAGAGGTIGDGGTGGIFVPAEKDPYTDEIKVAWIPTNAADANGTAWGLGIQRELEYWPNASYTMFDGERDSEKQASIIRDLIVQEYDAIILQAYNSAGIAEAVREAEEAGIPVICINIDADTPHAALVAMTDYEAGFVIGTQMAEDVGGEGNFVVIQATPGASRGENLEEGFQAAVANYPGITILGEQTGEWNSEKANAVMADFLTSFPQIDGVFCHNDQMAEGAADAIQAAGRQGEMSVWGANGETKALEYIEQGRMTGTIYTNCYDQGATAARLAMMYIGGNIDTSKFTETPVVKMPPIVVTADNVASITPDMRW